MTEEHPIFQAAKNGDEAEIKKWLEKKPNLISKNTESGKFTLLHIAHHSVIPMLVEAGVDINSKDGWGNTPLFWGDFEKIKALLAIPGIEVNELNHIGDNAIHAHITSDPDIVEALLEAGTSTKIINKAGMTILDYFYSIEDKGNIAPIIEELLMAAGAATNTENPIYDILHENNIPALKKMLENNPNAARIVSLRDLDNAPLHEATSIEAATLLLEHGADINHPNVFRETPLDKAEGELRDFLRNRGAMTLLEFIKEGNEAYELSPNDKDVASYRRESQQQQSLDAYRIETHGLDYDERLYPDEEHERSH